jgi:hypothetical protein
MSGHVVGKNSDSVAIRAVRYLRSRQPVKTAAAVEAETGISADTVRKWFAGAKPGFTHVLQLICCYGPGFLAAVMGDGAPTWLDDAARAERQLELEARIERQRLELDQLRRGRA